MGIAYETVVMMMKDPVRLLNPTELPSGIAPMPDAMIATKRVDSTGVPSFVLTLLKYWENGTAWSLARVQYVRQLVKTVPITQQREDIKIMKRRANVAAALPVA